ncbi:MAG: hypothetical protein EB058_12800 [Proteobacteria bacterium]|nr:hypothetical protein [Pseudomonadota bacterium]
MAGFAATNPDVQRVRVEALDAQRSAVTSMPSSATEGAPRANVPAVDAYRLPVGGSVSLNPDLAQSFTSVSTDGIDVSQAMTAIIVGRQAFQASRNAYQAAQSVLDSTLRVGL